MISWVDDGALQKCIFDNLFAVNLAYLFLSFIKTEKLI